jgi:hypothetical protein
VRWPGPAPAPPPSRATGRVGRGLGGGGPAPPPPTTTLTDDVAYAGRIRSFEAGIVAAPPTGVPFRHIRTRRSGFARKRSTLST